MQLTELTALLTQGDTFAISPTPVDRTLPRGHESRNREACPLGLVKATVLETSHPWTEQVAFGCQGVTHPVERKTGVLVRVRLPDLEGEGVHVDRLLTSDHAEHVADTKTVIQLVIARKAVMMPWSDYQPTRDYRRKQKRESDRRSARCESVTEMLGAKNWRWHDVYDDDRKARVYRAEDATVTLSLQRAEEIAALLAGAPVDLAA